MYTFIAYTLKKKNGNLLQSFKFDNINIQYKHFYNMFNIQLTIFIKIYVIGMNLIYTEF